MPNSVRGRASRRPVRLASALATLLLLSFLAGLPASEALAQERPSPAPRLPAEVLADVDAVFNSPLTRRAIGPVTIGADDVVATDLAVLDGPLVIAGRVTGSVLAVNAPVRLEPGAVIEGALLVVGGELEQLGDARVEGRVRVHPVRVTVRWDGSRLTVPDALPDSAQLQNDLLPDWWERLRSRDMGGSGFTLTSGGTYNRVEGLAIMAGPLLRRTIPSGLVTLEALGILRTAQDFRWDSENLGHRVTAQAEFGGTRRFTVGGRLHDVVAPTDDWSLSALEAGLAAFLGQRDLRDHYGRHGGELFTGVTYGDARLQFSYASERWGARDRRSVATLFHGSQGWRENPRLDVGRVRVGELSLIIDTRNAESNPWAGWYLEADYEVGSGDLARETIVDDIADPLAGRTDWGRVFVDARRYARISPSAQLNLRVVLGGWLHGDPLPLQRRLALGGPGTLPGYDFRQPVGTDDPLTCGGNRGASLSLALCDRIALVQMDYKGELPAPRVRSLEHYGWPSTLQWVVFGDAGRGWLVDRGPAGLRESSTDIPDVGSWLASVGVGMEAGAVGVYLSRAVSTSGRAPNVFIRLGQRF